MDFLKRRGGSDTQKEGMSTAFMAEWGSGGPAIGIHGEYDALGGALPDRFSRQGACLRGCARARLRT
jgi:metal-dependent amidase/aminoacylase/carboxypeptidase family protein